MIEALSATLKEILILRDVEGVEAKEGCLPLRHTERIGHAVPAATLFISCNVDAGYSDCESAPPSDAHPEVKLTS